MLASEYFDQDAVALAKNLLGKVIHRKFAGRWLYARIIETEAYYKTEKGSHSSLGFTEKRKALFMPAGTIYMYYARGKDSLNVSANGPGNAVLIKSAYPYELNPDFSQMIAVMQKLNPKGDKLRAPDFLLSGQTLLCSALNLKVIDWNQKNFSPDEFFFADTGYKPEKILVAPRLGIPIGRDEHLLYRFVDARYNKFCTKPIREV